jgi:transposase
VTETCEPDTPHVLVQITTPPGATADESMLTPIPHDLARHNLLPRQQLVDAGYLDAEGLATSRTQFGVDLVGPTRGDYRWQARDPTRFDRSRFRSDWAAQQVTCPEGRTSTAWTPAFARRPRVPRPVIMVKFAQADCRTCPSRARCTTLAQRTLTLHPQQHEEALRAARAREQTPEFTDAYAQRAGVESAHAQGLRVCGLRRARYVGLAKTQLQHVLTAVALTLLRLSAWLTGTPLAPTRQSALARLMTHAAWRPSARDFATSVNADSTLAVLGAGRRTVSMDRALERTWSWRVLAALSPH